MFVECFDDEKSEYEPRGVGPTPAVCVSFGPRFVNGEGIAVPFILRCDDPSSCVMSLFRAMLPPAAATAANCAASLTFSFLVFN